MNKPDPYASDARNLYLRPHLFIVHSGTDEDDLRLAEDVANQCKDFTRPRCGTIAELKQRSQLKRLFIGITLVILSPAMLADADRRAALVRQMRHHYQQTLFRHYCVCRGMPHEALREYPELATILDNVMAGDSERSLPAILAELREYVTRVLPSSPELLQPVRTFFRSDHLARTFAALALGLMLLVGRLSSLARLAAAVLAVLWWQGWTPTGAGALASFSAFYGGFWLNHLQNGDLWPWLARRWKLPRNSIVTTDRPRGWKALAIGPVSIGGFLLALTFDHTSQWIESAICVLAGLLGQSLLDYWNTRQLRSRLRFGADAEQALAAVETPDATGTRLSLEGLFRAAGGVVAAFYGGMLISLAIAALLIVPAFLVARMLSPDAIAWIATAALTGLLVPGLLEHFAHSGVRYMGEYAGLSSADDSLYKKLAGNPSAKLTSRKSVPAAERVLVQAFPPEEQKFILQWVSNIRFGLRRNSFRRWWPSADYAFISYAWRDDTQAGVAGAVAAACKAANIEHFLDKLTLQSREGVFRMPLAAGLSKSTHVFLVVTPGIASGQVVRREIEMAMGRWRGEMLPAIICVVEPQVCEQLLADPATPLPLRFLLSFCPQMTPAEASQPALVRYVIELTRREGKWSDWRLLLSPQASFAQVMRLPGITA